jgi:putative protein kinase ArgK-like GTPase of G3E family
MGRVGWPELVERESELGAIDTALVSVDEGAGAFVLFDGEPGIGKSALLHELTLRARARHVRVLAGLGGVTVVRRGGPRSGVAAGAALVGGAARAAASAGDRG